MARLGDDLASLAETPQLVKVDPNGHDVWGPYGQKTDDKPCLHYTNGARVHALVWCPVRRVRACVRVSRACVRACVRPALSGSQTTTGSVALSEGSQRARATVGREGGRSHGGSFR